MKKHLPLLILTLFLASGSSGAVVQDSVKHTLISDSGTRYEGVVTEGTNVSFAQDSTFGQSHQDSTEVKNNSITLAGASIGFATGSSMFLLAGISGRDMSFPEFKVMMLGPGFINGAVIPNYLESENKGYLRAGMLVSSCATTVMPMLGAMFGAANSDPSTVATIIFMGTIGGVIYNHGLALIFPKYREALKTAKFKRRKQSADDN